MRQTTFFCDADYMLYKSLMALWCRRYQVEIWAYCLMPNHVHLIAVPPTENSLRDAIGGAHNRYTRAINQRQKWSGHLWQGRFFSYPMDDVHLLMAARYIERNPVRKNLVDVPDDYLWSSARHHISGAIDPLVDPSPLTQMTENWREFISPEEESWALEEIRLHQKTGRPVGSEEFLLDLEKATGRLLRPQRAGRRRKETQATKNEVGVPELTEASLF